MSLKPLEQSGIRLDWKAWKLPFDANPPAKPEGYANGAKQYLEKLIKETGLQIQPPSTKRDTYLAHVGAKYAKSKGLFDAYHQRIFEAVWEKDENIEDLTFLANVAKEIGLNSNKFLEAITGDEYRNIVENDYESAVQNKIWTIPSYLGQGGIIQVHHYQDMPTVNDLKKII